MTYFIVFVGCSCPLQTTHTNRLKYTHKDGSSVKLLFPCSLWSCNGFGYCRLFSIPSIELPLNSLLSVQLVILIILGCSIFSNFSFATAMNRMTHLPASLAIHLFRDQTTFPISRNISFERYFFQSSWLISQTQFPLLQALVNAISQVRLDFGKTPPQIRQFFIDQLRYNDNTTNHVRFFCYLYIYHS